MKSDFIWTENKYNIDYTLLRDEWEEFMIVDKIHPSQIISSSAKILDLDLNTCNVEDLQFTCEYSVDFRKHAQKLNSLVLWFDVDFPVDDPANEKERVVLSTAPDSPMTHWNQSILYF
jgi:hypothetical protein